MLKHTKKKEAVYHCIHSLFTDMGKQRGEIGDHKQKGTTEFVGFVLQCSFRVPVEIMRMMDTDI
jgi:hypothetical protein